MIITTELQTLCPKRPAYCGKRVLLMYAAVPVGDTSLNQSDIWPRQVA